MRRVHIEPYSNCWLWDGSASKDDYGVIGYKGTPTVYVHRLMFLIANGHLPSDLCVLHKCDNTRCCNPRHLFPGTHADNMRDCFEKGRRPRGMRHWKAELTDAKIIEIRRFRNEDGLKLSELAARFGVSYSQIWRIVHNNNWRHVA